MNSVEKVKALCKEKRIPISRLERDLGFSNGYIGQLKKGVFPADRAMAIAEYLNVDANFLIGAPEQKEKPTETNLDGRIPGFDDLSEENKLKAREYVDMLLKLQQTESL